MFFQDFWTWLDARLSTYVSVHAADLAAALEPVAVTLGVLYVMFWGWLHLRGQIEEPFMEGVRRIFTLFIVFGVALHLWAYHDVLVSVFYEGPTQLAAAILGAQSPVALIDAIWAQGGAVADTLWGKGSLLTGDGGFYIAGLLVYLLVGFACLYTLFLISLSKIALAVLLALGPLFILLTLFDATRRLFDAWIHELTNYGLVSILTVMVTTLLLDLLSTYAEQTATRGGDLLTVDALDLALAAGLVILVLLQVMPMAARLAGGFALATQGVVDRGVDGLRRAVRSLGSRGYTYFSTPAPAVAPTSLLQPTRPLS
ncbi:MAG: type IV secretion system protein [Pseudomonadota bacterium]|jgi:type IV secretion system protein VirB6